MTTYRVVTAFDRDYYDKYGKLFLESYLKHKTHQIWCYYEGRKPGIVGPRYVNRLSEQETDGHLIYFRNKFGKNPACHGYVKDENGKYHINYRYQAMKFVNKVCCLNYFGTTSTSDFLIWIDADVIVKKPFDAVFMDAVCKPEYLAAYIGRKGWPHSECGFMTFRLDNCGRRFLEEFAQVYLSGAFMRCMEWHDSWVFDMMREIYTWKGHKFLNLAPGREEMHPWPHTILGDYMDHHKGPEAKERFYGQISAA